MCTLVLIFNFDQMTTLVAGASGATGKHLVDQLLSKGQKVKMIVRSTATIPGDWKNNDKIVLIEANISEMSVAEMKKCLAGCQSVASCLGHNISLKGMYGKPRKLVRNAVRLICSAIQDNAPEKPIRFVLMNTTANRNRDLSESISVGEKLLMGVIRFLLPPQSDNEKAADYLREQIGQENKSIEWVAVRPDTLTNEEMVSEYELHHSPVRSAMFNPGRTSRVNVGNFMAGLLLENDLWNRWKGQMPVVYNKTPSPQDRYT